MNQKVLIVDDEPDIRELLVEFLDGVCQTVERENGQQLVDYVMGGEPVDLIVTDLKMPKLNGLEALAMLQGKAPPIAHIPTIVLTGIANEKVLGQSLKFGADDFLVKPVSFAPFRSRVETLVRKPLPFDVTKDKLRYATIDDVAALQYYGIRESSLNRPRAFPFTIDEDRFVALIPREVKMADIADANSEEGLIGKVEIYCKDTKFWRCIWPSSSQFLAGGGQSEQPEADNLKIEYV